MHETKVLCSYSVIEIDGVKYHHHPHGGGLVAESAYADPTVYIDVAAMVTEGARVLDRVRMEGRACVCGKAEVRGDVCLRDDVVIAGGSTVGGTAKFSDEVRVCNHSDIDGDMWFSGHSLISHARVRGGGRHHNAQIVNEEKQVA